MQEARQGITLRQVVTVALVLIVGACLFAIVWPVCQSGRSRGQTWCVSSIKQISQGIHIYTTDYDGHYPLSLVPDPSTGGYRTDAWYTVPPNWRRDKEQEYADAMALSWPNAVYPYVQNWAIYSCDKPRKKRLNADYEQPRRGPVTVSYTYNGLLHAFPHSEIAYPGELPVIWEGLGDVAVLGFATTQPTLICDIPGLPCRFQSVAGPHSILSVPLGTMYIHSKGTNMAHADTHAKWRRVGAVISPKSAGPPFTEWDFDPFTGYDEGGNPGWYWAYGIHPWLFRPDNTFDPADYPTPGDVRPRPLFPFKDPD